MKRLLIVVLFVFQAFMIAQGQNRNPFFIKKVDILSESDTAVRYKFWGSIKMSSDSLRTIDSLVLKMEGKNSEALVRKFPFTSRSIGRFNFKFSLSKKELDVLTSYKVAFVFSNGDWSPYYAGAFMGDLNRNIDPFPNIMITGRYAVTDKNIQQLMY